MTTAEREEILRAAEKALLDASRLPDGWVKMGAALAKPLSLALEPCTEPKYEEFRHRARGGQARMVAGYLFEQFWLRPGLLRCAPHLLDVAASLHAVALDVQGPKDGEVV